jgi:hypothetical protein
MEEKNQIVKIKSGLIDIVNSNLPAQTKALEYIKFQKNLTLEGAILSNNFLAKFTGELETKALTSIQELLSNLQDSLNVDKKLSLTQEYETATLLIEKYGNILTLEEVALVFKKAKMSEYGKIFNRIDVQIIFEWIEKYLESEDKQGFFERYNKRNEQPIGNLNWIAKAPECHLKELKENLNKMLDDDRKKNWERSSIHNEQREKLRVDAEKRFIAKISKEPKENLEKLLEFHKDFKNELEASFIEEELKKRNNGKN